MMRRLIYAALLVLPLAGCAHALGYAGAHPGYIKCMGKGSITGTGAATAGAGIGGSEQNSFTIQADCGTGFEFRQGMPAADVPAKP